MSRRRDNARIFVALSMAVERTFARAIGGNCQKVWREELDAALGKLSDEAEPPDRDDERVVFCLAPFLVVCSCSWASWGGRLHRGASALTGSPIAPPLNAALRALETKYGRAQADVLFNKLSTEGTLAYSRPDGRIEPSFCFLKMLGGPEVVFG